MKSDTIGAMTIGAAGLLALVVVLWGPISTGDFISAGDLGACGFKAAYEVPLRDQFDGCWDNTMFGRCRGPVNPIHWRPYLIKLMPPPTSSCGHYPIWILFAADYVMIGLAAGWFMRSYSLSWSLCALCGVAMMLGGSTGTLIAAGHLSKYDALPFSILALGCVRRAITQDKFIYWPLAGVTGAISLAEHSDVSLMFGLLIAAVGIYDFVCVYRAIPKCRKAARQP